MRRSSCGWAAGPRVRSCAPRLPPARRIVSRSDLYGSRAGLEWHQEEPNTLLYKVPGRPWERLRTGQLYLSAPARAASRLPPGHPEGYLEAFATLYRSFIADVRRVQRGDAPLHDYPGAHEGVRGLRFVTQAVASSQAGGVWRDL